MCLFFSTLILKSSVYFTGITYKYLIQSSTESIALHYTTSGPGSTIGGVANFQLFPLMKTRSGSKLLKIVEFELRLNMVSATIEKRVQDSQ